MAEMSQADAQAEVSSQANPKNENPVYEIGFHIVPTVAEGGVGAVVDSIREELAKHNAEIIKEDFPAKRTLAYVIERSTAGKREKYAEAYFGSIKFAVENREALPALQAWLRGSKEILRSLVIETARDEVAVSRRAVFSSDRLEGETIHKPSVQPEKASEVSQEELDKSIDALVS